MAGKQTAWVVSRRRLSAVLKNRSAPIRGRWGRRRWSIMFIVTTTPNTRPSSAGEAWMGILARADLRQWPSEREAQCRSYGAWRSVRHVCL